MGERTIRSSVPGITPVQQMLASGTGAVLTSVFGNISYGWAIIEYEADVIGQKDIPPLNKGKINT